MSFSGASNILVVEPIMAQAFYPSIQKAEAGRTLFLRGQPVSTISSISAMATRKILYNKNNNSNNRTICFGKCEQKSIGCKHHALTPSNRPGSEHRYICT